MITAQVPKGFFTPPTDGWIPWNGGRCPVPGDTLVEVELRDVGIEEDIEGEAI